MIEQRTLSPVIATEQETRQDILHGEVLPQINYPAEVERYATVARFTGLVSELSDAQRSHEEIPSEKFDEYVQFRYAIKTLLLPDAKKDTEEQKIEAKALNEDIQHTFIDRGLLKEPIEAETEQAHHVPWTVAVDILEQQMQPQLISAAQRYLAKKYDLQFVASDLSTEEIKIAFQKVLPQLQLLGIDREVSNLVDYWTHYASLPMIVNDIESTRRREIKEYERNYMLSSFVSATRETPLKDVLENDAFRGNKHFPFELAFAIVSRRAQQTIAGDKAENSRVKMLQQIKEAADRFVEYYREEFLRIPYGEYLEYLLYERAQYEQQLQKIPDSPEKDELTGRYEKMKKKLAYHKLLIDYECKRSQKDDPSITMEEVLETHSLPVKDVKRYDIMTNQQRQQLVHEMRPRAHDAVLCILQTVAALQAA